MQNKVSADTLILDSVNVYCTINVHYRSYIASEMKQRANGTNMDGWVDIVQEVAKHL